VFFYQQRSEH